LVTGLLGDLPAPASCALGGFISSLPTGGNLQLVVGRRGQFSAGAALAAAAVAVLLALVKYARAFDDPPLDGLRDAASDVASEPGQSDLAGDGAN
jgi:hypothetical protein